jgi:hypothetical protein
LFGSVLPLIFLNKKGGTTPASRLQAEMQALVVPTDTIIAVGSPHFSAAGTTYNSLAFDTSGDPYVAYSDGSFAGGSKVTVMEYH